MGGRFKKKRLLRWLERRLLLCIEITFMETCFEDVTAFKMQVLKFFGV